MPFWLSGMLIRTFCFAWKMTFVLRSLMSYTCTFLMLFNASGFARLRYGSIDRRGADRFRQTSYAKGISRGFAQAQGRYDFDRRRCGHDDPCLVLLLVQRFGARPYFFRCFRRYRRAGVPVDTDA